MVPIGSCRVGADTGVPTHLLGSPPCRRDFGAVVVAGFWLRAQNPHRPCFESRFGGARGDALTRERKKMLLHTDSVFVVIAS
jgi:hypothetical protein